MAQVVRAMPVLFACRGCPRDAAARALARERDRRGEAEASVMGADEAKARSRFPIHVVEGCAKACATQWLASIGVRPHHSTVLDESGPEPD